MTVVSVPQFPDVPFGPGVPSVLRAAGVFSTTDVGSLLTSDATDLGVLAAPQWGIFTTAGDPVLTTDTGVDTVISVDMRREARIITAPTEMGGFQSYNKVALPNDARLRMAVAGSSDARAAFLQQLDALQDDLNLYAVVTPDATYPNVNQIHYDYSRQRQGGGASMVVVDVWFEEVRQSAQASTNPVSSPQQPTSNAPQDGGQVQPQVPPPQSGLSSQAPAVSQQSPVPAQLTPGPPAGLGGVPSATVLQQETGQTGGPGTPATGVE